MTDHETLIKNLEYHKANPTVAGVERYGEMIVQLPVTLVDDVITTIIALWRDIDKARPCFACKNHCKCDPNDDKFKKQYWEKCGEFSKKNWEWRGYNNG